MLTVISCRCDQLFVIQNFDNFRACKTGQSQIENMTDDFGWFRVNNKVCPFRVQFVAKTGSSNKITIFHTLGIAGKHLCGKIPAVVAVQDGFEHNRHIIGQTGGNSTVILIINRNKPNIQEGKDLLNVIANNDIIAGKSGKILDDDTLDFSLTGKTNHTLKFRPVFRGAGISVIHKFLNPPMIKFRVGSKVIMNQFPLVADGRAFILVFIQIVIGMRKTDIAG